MSDIKKDNWREREIGALWLKESPKGSKFLSGTINGKKISVWKNKFHEEGTNLPYYRIYDDTESPSPSSQKETPQQTKKSDDIPF